MKRFLEWLLWPFAFLACYLVVVACGWSLDIEEDEWQLTL